MNRNSLAPSPVAQGRGIADRSAAQAAAEAAACRRAKLRARHAARKSVPEDYRFHRLVPSGLSSMTMPWEARN